MTKRMIGGVVLTVALLATLALGTAWAQQSESRTLQLTPSRDSGVSGTATLTNTSNGVEVRLSLQGLPEDGVEHLAHIHSGATCADERGGQGGPVEFPLESVTAQGGTGSSTTEIRNVTLGQLFDGTPRYVNAHDKMTGRGVPPSIACADLVFTGTQERPMIQEQTMKAGTTTVLQPTGGGSVGGPAVVLPAAAALLVGSGVLAYTALRRRR